MFSTQKSDPVRDQMQPKEARKDSLRFNFLMNFIRWAEFAFSIAALVVCANIYKIFDNHQCSVPGRVTFNLAVAAVTVALSIYFIFATATIKLRAIPYSFWLALVTDIIFLALWIASGSLIGTYDCNAACGDCTNYGLQHHSDFNATWYQFSLAFFQPGCVCGIPKTTNSTNTSNTRQGLLSDVLLEKRASIGSSASRAGQSIVKNGSSSVFKKVIQAAIRHGLDWTMAALFLMALVVTGVLMFWYSKKKHPDTEEGMAIEGKDGRNNTHSGHSQNGLHEARQHDHNAPAPSPLTAFLSEIKPFKIETAPPKSPLKNVQRKRIFYGPYTLQPANAKKAPNVSGMDPNSESWNGIAGGIPLDSTLLFAKNTLEYENGKIADQASGVYNHHVAFIDTNKFTPLFASCPSSSAVSPGAVPSSMPSLGAPAVMMGASEEIGSNAYSTPDGTFNSGFYIGKADKVIMSGEVVNYSNDTKVIYAVSDVEFIPGRPPGSLDVQVQVLSVNQCETKDIRLHAPEGKKAFSFQSQNITVLNDGYILSRRGHLHDGGVNIDFKVNGKTICDSRAIYGGEKGSLKTEDGVWETVSATVECHEPVKVSKGDVITLSAHYDLEKHPARKHTGGGMAEEMGIMSFNFATEAK
ncbi:hypothetical protein BT63DRAFT_478836 [Microthyrium microscopicum]|uniref:MARVEL domain-containing protein n=1 Tax=Microthyrium microscopicum TaxID=703497 RepID=A0A6A6UDF0_9PEZI|nr:hypothetical protein BT63DRAFT_478836 [Microthyrium microscopicum]